MQGNRKRKPKNTLPAHQKESQHNDTQQPKFLFGKLFLFFERYQY